MLKPVDFEEFEEYLKAYRTPDNASRPIPGLELPVKCHVFGVFTIIYVNGNF